MCLSECTENTGREEETAFTEAMTNFHSLSKSTVICAVLPEQVQHFSKVLGKFLQGIFFNLLSYLRRKFG